MTSSANSVAEDRSEYNDTVMGYDQHSLKSSFDSSRSSDKEGSKLMTKKSNTSELSRMISGILDDVNQGGSAHAYKDTIIPEAIIAEELERVSRLSTRQDEDDEILNENESRTICDEKEKEDEFPPPDKGFAWVIAFISMLAVFATWGSNASFGVFLDYYIEANVFEGASEYDFALIGGIVVALAQSLCPLATLAYRLFGIHAIVTTGIILQTLGYVLASLATKLWQLYLCQGLLVGISFGMIFLPATIILPTWFDKRRAFAFGIAVSGAGLGGIVFSLSVHKVFEISGNQHWGLRLAALMSLITALPCFFLRTRTGVQLPFKQRMTYSFLKENVKLIFNFKVFKSIPVAILMLWFLCAVFGYVIVLFSISSYATLVGLSASQGSILTALLNVGQTIGRPAMGLVADKVGRINFAVYMSLSIAILLWAYWINATTFAAMIPLCLLVGAIVGVGSVMSQPILSGLVDTPADFTAGWSGMNIVVGIFSLVAEVVALALKQKNASRPFLHPQIFTGSIYFFCFMLMLTIRQFAVSKAIRNMLEISKNRLTEISTSRSRYLTTNDLQQQDNQEELELINQRIERYEYLLGNSIQLFIIRIFYPIKV